MKPNECEAILQGPGVKCTAPPTMLVTFHDGQRARTCQDCALSLQQAAEGVKTRVKTERLVEKKT
jgi:hypothetical protein